MKKTILSVIALLFLAGVTFTSCSNDNSSEKNSNEASSETTGYHCPMQCEGEKTYHDPGSCPECGMDLVK